MADKPQVVKLAQPGFNAADAGDENLVYNSNWPLFKIFKQGSFASNDSNTANQLITKHDLGYVPMFWYFSNQDIRTWNSAYNITQVQERSEYLGALNTFFPAASKDGLYFEINPGGPYNSVQFYYYIFALDITKEYTAPVIKSGGVIGPRNLKTVFKIAKPDKDISSPRLEDYIVHSAARSPLIHAVRQFTTGKDNFIYNHNLGYIPMFFAYSKAGVVGTINPIPDSWVVWPTIGSISGFRVDEQKITFDNNVTSPGAEMSVVVLKDPFNLSNSINVTV